MKFSKAVVKHRVLILILALALCVPAFFGMVATRINYDMLDYLPEDMDTVIGQNELLNDFGKGAFSLIIVEDMQPKDISAMKEKIEKVDHVETVLWYDSIFDISIPMEILPDEIYIIRVGLSKGVQILVNHTGIRLLRIANLCELHGVCYVSRMRG